MSIFMRIDVKNTKTKQNHWHQKKRNALINKKKMNRALNFYTHIEMYFVVVNGIEKYQKKNTKSRMKITYKNQTQMVKP